MLVPFVHLQQSSVIHKCDKAGLYTLEKVGLTFIKYRIWFLDVWLPDSSSFLVFFPVAKGSIKSRKTMQSRKRKIMWKVGSLGGCGKSFSSKNFHPRETGKQVGFRFLITWPFWRCHVSLWYGCAKMSLSRTTSRRRDFLLWGRVAFVGQKFKVSENRFQVHP